MNQLYLRYSIKTPPKSTPSFTGKERDSETGFSYFGARYYDSDLMTGWLSVDPMADKYPGVSPYAYCGWNPILFRDPDGKEKIIYFDTKIPEYRKFQEKDNAYRLYQIAMKQYKSNISLTASASKYKDNNYVIHLFAHGSSQKVDLVANGKKDAKNLELFLLNASELYQKNINDGKTSLLIMHSCETGKGENSIAQELSKLADENLLVIAPSEILLLGNSESVDKNGVWNVFYKGKLLGSYKGNIDFQKQLEGKNIQNVINHWIKKYKKQYDDN